MSKLSNLIPVTIWIISFVFLGKGEILCRFSLYGESWLGALAGNAISKINEYIRFNFEGMEDVSIQLYSIDNAILLVLNGYFENCDNVLFSISMSLL